MSPEPNPSRIPPSLSSPYLVPSLFLPFMLFSVQRVVRSFLRAVARRLKLKKAQQLSNLTEAQHLGDETCLSAPVCLTEIKNNNKQ